MTLGKASAPTLQNTAGPDQASPGGNVERVFPAREHSARQEQKRKPGLTPKGHDRAPRASKERGTWRVHSSQGLD